MKTFYINPSPGYLGPPDKCPVCQKPFTDWEWPKPWDSSLFEYKGLKRRIMSVGSEHAGWCFNTYRDMMDVCSVQCANTYLMGWANARLNRRRLELVRKKVRAKLRKEKEDGESREDQTAGCEQGTPHTEKFANSAKRNQDGQ